MLLHAARKIGKVVAELLERETKRKQALDLDG